MDTPQTQPLQPRVSRLTVSRLYNMGNYEHTRYEVSVEVPEGADASEAMRRLKDILWSLRPVKTGDTYSMLRAREALARQAAGEDLDKYDQDQLDTYREMVRRSEAGHARVSAAIAALKDLGGVSEFKDAKEKWDDEF